jgi:hypothetical protein
MFYIRDEGEVVKNGFNFYPLNSSHSIGVVIKVWKYALMVRYSKLRKKMFYVFSKTENSSL